jgi:hypothetical protein
MRLLLAQLFILVSVSCGRSGGALPIQEYYQAVRPLMYENKQLADQFTDLAGRIHLEQVTGDQVASEFETKLIPLAERLRSGASRIQLRDEQLSQVHGGLVEAWTLRSTAYTQMLKAYQESDTSIFEMAINTNASSKQKEESYFAQANGYFATENLHLFQFPESN